MKHAYFISGLGAQCRIFDKIILPDEYERHYLEFIPPHEDDDMRSYALRLGKEIKEDSIIIGLSLGGMMAIEIAKERKDIRVILLSSIPVKKEFPKHLQFLLNLRLHRLMNETILKKVFPFFSKKFISNSFDKSTQELLIDMLKQNDVRLYKWFIEAIKNWNNEVFPSRVIRIHGTSDKVLPLKNNTKIDCVVKGGSHVMLLDKYEEINAYLRTIL